VALLAAAVALASRSERVRVPAAVTLVALGAALGSFAHVRPPFAFGPALLVALLPPLVFEAAWNIDAAAMRAGAGRIALLAFPGTLFTAFAVAVALTATHVAPFADALVFGAIVSATDPVAVVGVFRRTGVSARVRTIAEAESLANDGVAVVLYGIAVAAASGMPLSIVTACVSGGYAVAGGVALGAACAMPFVVVRRLLHSTPFAIAATIALAYGAYQAADHAHASGIFATAAAALVLHAVRPEPATRMPVAPRGDTNDDVGQPADADDPRGALDAFWGAVAYGAKATVFFATGLLLDVPRALHEPAFAIVGIVALLATRAVLAVLAAGSNVASRAAIFLAGMRGGLPLALALALPAALPGRAQIVDGVFATVLATLVVQGALLEPILRGLRRQGSGARA